MRRQIQAEWFEVNLLRKRRGVSGIISGVFLVAVAVMVFNVLAWQFFQSDAYNRIFQERQQREWERYNERIEISNVDYGFGYLRFKVSNPGAVAAHIVEIWLNDTTTNTPRHLSLSNYLTSNCSAWISSGAERWMNTTILLTYGHEYSLKIATERGNIAVAPNLKPTTETPTGYQPVPLTFGFAYDDYQYNTVPDIGDPNWMRAWVFTVPGGNLYFRIKLKNTAGGDIVIETRSHINFVISSGSSAMQSKANSPLLNPVTLTEGSEGWLVYAAIPSTKFEQGTMQYYAFFAIFYHYTSRPTETLGTMVAVLASEVTR